MRPSNGTVYVVDDDDGVRQSLALLLELEGLKARTFDSSDDVLSHAGELSSGCLVLDYHMPGRNGLQLLDSLRERGVDLPTVLITGGGTPVIEEQARRAGVLYMEKPVSTDRLISVIENALP